MVKRVCIAMLEVEASEPEAFVVAWPWSNSPKDLTPEFSRVVSKAVAGLPVVLLAVDAEGIHSFGRREHAVAAGMIDFRTIRWSLIDVEDGRDTAATRAA